MFETIVLYWKQVYFVNPFIFVSMLRCRKQSLVKAEPISLVNPVQTHLPMNERSDYLRWQYHCIGNLALSK